MTRFRVSGSVMARAIRNRDYPSINHGDPGLLSGR